VESGVVQESCFFNRGSQLRHYRDRVNKWKQEYQEKGRYDKVEELGDRKARFTRQLLHNISRKIVDAAEQYERPVIRVEDTDIEKMRKQVNTQDKNWFKTRINRWPVGQLINFIEYKAEKAGIKVERVSPEYTSQECNKCGERGVRPYKGNQQRFYCRNCDYEVDADFNAAINIAEKGR
jgi:IS605 OrfB family transposase